MAKKKQNGGPSSGKDDNADNFEELDLNNINKFISRFLEHADKQFAKTGALDQPHVEFDGKSMEISASNKDRSYHKVVPLGSEVDEKSYSLKYNNGVLEITMRKK